MLYRTIFLQDKYHDYDYLKINNTDWLFNNKFFKLNSSWHWANFVDLKTLIKCCIKSFYYLHTDYSYWFETYTNIKNISVFEISKEILNSELHNSVNTSWSFITKSMDNYLIEFKNGNSFDEFHDVLSEDKQQYHKILTDTVHDVKSKIKNQNYETTKNIIIEKLIDKYKKDNKSSRYFPTIIYLCHYGNNENSFNDLIKYYDNNVEIVKILNS